MSDTPIGTTGPETSGGGIVTPQDPNASNNTPTPAMGAGSSSESFLGEIPNTKKESESMYNDFFQEGSDGNITIGKKATRSGLEIFVSIMNYITIIVVLLGILGVLHVTIRNTQSSELIKNYPFFCGYLSYDIETATPQEKNCKTITAIKKDYEDRFATLKENIIDALTEYIPIKVSSSILDASPEKSFAIETYKNKPKVNDVLGAFDATKKRAQYIGSENIQCTGVTVTEGNKLSTQCTIYGGPIGNDDVNGQIGSARIEALHFVETLSDTSKSSLILENPPTFMAIEETSKEDQENFGFFTRTILSIQVRYVSISQKP